jgi:hypothetical protein
LEASEIKQLAAVTEALLQKCTKADLHPRSPGWSFGGCAERPAAIDDGKAFPSLIPHDGWRGREDRILMRNAYADFGISVYGGLVAVWIVERDDGAYWDADWRTARSPRAQRWLSQIASRFDAVFGDYNCLGHMSNGEGVYTKRAA